MTSLTPPEHEHSEAVILAATWLADQSLEPLPIVPALQQRFGLTPMEATEAAAIGIRFRTVRKAFG